MNIERRLGREKPVIRKALVELNAAPFQLFAALREGWKLSDDYRNPGAIQYSEHGDALNLTLQIEKHEKLHKLLQPENTNRNTNTSKQISSKL